MILRLTTVRENARIPAFAGMTTGGWSFYICAGTALAL